MKKIIMTLSVFILVVVFSLAYGQSAKQNQRTTVPDQHRVKENQLSFLDAKEALTLIFDALKSFRGLTNLIESKTKFSTDYNRLIQQKQPITGVKYSLNITLDELNKVGNVEWEIQNIGFDNRITLIGGTLLSQQTKIKELEYEVLKLRMSSQKEIEKAKRDFAESKKQLNHFLQTRSWTD